MMVYYISQQWNSPIKVNFNQTEFDCNGFYCLPENNEFLGGICEIMI